MTCLLAQLCLTLVTPWTVARQAPLSMGFSRQEYWSGLPFSTLGDLPDPGIHLASPASAGGFFTTTHATSESIAAAAKSLSPPSNAFQIYD